MNFTIGEILFYSGIVGMAAVLVISVVVIAVLSSAKKKLLHKFDDENCGRK